MNDTTKQRIAIIGGGRVGTAIAAVLEQLGGYDSYIFDHVRNPACGADSKLFISSDPEAVLSELKTYFTGQPKENCAVIFALSHKQAMPWLELFNKWLPRDLKFMVAGRPSDVNRAAFHRRAIHFGVGLEPGLAEALLHHMASRLPNADGIETFCGGVPRHPKAPAWHMMHFATETTFSNRNSFSRVGGKTVNRPRFYSCEEINLENIGLVEVYDDAILPETLAEPSLDHIRSLRQRTVRWPGFVQFAQSKASPAEKEAAVLPQPLSEDMVILAARATQRGRNIGSVQVVVKSIVGESAMSYTTALGVVAALCTAQERPCPAGCIFPADSGQEEIFNGFTKLAKRLDPHSKRISISQSTEPQSENRFEQEMT
ncbi:MAG: hypothetical protein ABJO27_26525 [Pseudoruegeria sp.]